MLDLVIIVLAYYLILVFPLRGLRAFGHALRLLQLDVFLCAAVVLHLCLNAIFRVYSIVNRYVGLAQAMWIVKASVLSVCILLLLDLVLTASAGRLIPLSVVVVGGAFACAAMIAAAFLQPRVPGHQPVSREPRETRTHSRSGGRGRHAGAEHRPDTAR